jgi:hypothetical protein
MDALQEELRKFSDSVEYESTLQQRLLGLLDAFVKTDAQKEVEVRDTSLNAVLQGQKPDAVLVKKGSESLPITVQAVLELKCITSPKKDFSNSHKGQAAKYIIVCLKHQPWRESVACLLLSNGSACLMTGTRHGMDRDSIIFFLTYAEKRYEIAYLIHMWLSVTPTELPFEDLATKKYDVLSQGKTATVWKIGDDLIVKWFCTPEDRDYEWNMLKLVKGVANVVEVDDENSPTESPWLLFPYCGVPLSAYDSDLALVVLRALSAVHERKVLHRDIKPGNIVFNKINNDICLIDFGLAMAVDDLKCVDSFVGTSSFAPQGHLLADDWLDFVYSPATDLESFVKTCIYLNEDDAHRNRIHQCGDICRRAKFDSGTGVTHFELLHSSWEAIFRSERVYQEALNAALENDIASLASCLKKFPKKRQILHRSSESRGAKAKRSQGKSN